MTGTAYLAQIETLEAEATRLLTEAQHATMKDQVQRTQAELREGRLWIGQNNFDTRPDLHKIVDLILLLAAQRLKFVKDALDKYGPGAMLM